MFVHRLDTLRDDDDGYGGVMAGLGYQLDVPGKTETQLRTYLHQIGLGA